MLSERLKIEDILNFLRRLSREIKFIQVEGGFVDNIHQQAFIGLFKLLKNLQWRDEANIDVLLALEIQGSRGYCFVAH